MKAIFFAAIFGLLAWNTYLLLEARQPTVMCPIKMDNHRGYWLT